MYVSFPYIFTAHKYTALTDLHLLPSLSNLLGGAFFLNIERASSVFFFSLYSIFCMDIPWFLWPVPCGPSLAMEWIHISVISHRYPGTKGTCVATFDGLGQIACYRGCTILHSWLYPHPQCVIRYWVSAILISKTYYLRKVLICHIFIISVVGHLFFKFFHSSFGFH